MSGTSAIPWVPSEDRIIPLFDYAACAPLGRIPTQVPRRWTDKGTLGVLDYGLDATAWIATTTDPLASASAAATPSDLTIGTVTIVGGVVVVWLSAGTAGVLYAVTVTIATASGQIVNAPVTLLVAQDAAPAPPPAPAITDDSAAVLTDDSGNPLLVSGPAGSPVTGAGVILTDANGNPIDFTD